MASDNAAQIIERYEEALNETYIYAACAALLLYDYVITMGQEISFMWSNERQGSALIFIANRCIVLGMAVSIILELPNIPGINVGPTYCKVIVILFQVAYIASLAIWTVFSALRVYAICDKRRYLPVITTAVGLIPVGTELAIQASSYFDIIGDACVQNSRLSAETQFQYSHSAITVDIVARAALIAADAIVVFATWRSVHGDIQRLMQSASKLSLMELVLRDGIVYFTLLLLLNIVNICIRLLKPNIQLAPLAATFTSICIYRIILNLREACFVKQDPSEYRNTTRNEMNDTLQFRPQRVTARSRDAPTTGTVPAIDVHASISEDIRTDSVQSQMTGAHRCEEGDVESARREIHRCFDDDFSDDLLTDDERA